MTFNTTQTSSTYINNLISTGQNNVLAPFWDDMVIQGNNIANLNTSMKYKVIGTLGSGSADIVIEWAEMEKFLYSDPNMNFQVVLHESNNSIDFNYGNMQLFNGASNNTTYGYWTYTVGMNGSSPATASFVNRLILQYANSNNFGTASVTTLKGSPDCSSQLRFVPAATTAKGDAANTTLATNTGTLAKTNYVFDGWNTAANGTGTSYAAGAANFASPGNTTLYAQWKAVITYNGNTNNGGASPAATNAITASISLPGNSSSLTKTGYAFDGWNTAADGSGTKFAAGSCLKSGSLKNCRETLESFSPIRVPPPFFENTD
jgi:uncharacterized repeat protein (TIGR02543 family)